MFSKGRVSQRRVAFGALFYHIGIFHKRNRNFTQLANICPLWFRLSFAKCLVWKLLISKKEYEEIYSKEGIILFPRAMHPQGT